MNIPHIHYFCSMQWSFIKRYNLVRSNLITLFLCITIMSVAQPSSHAEIKIAVTKAAKNYINWLTKGDSTIIAVDLYNLPLDSAIAVLSECSGLLVTGGEDVQPSLYGKDAFQTLCKEMDPRRDTHEIEAIKKAFEKHMPVLGICRGEQIINVALGGTLIPDIPNHFKQSPSQSKDTIKHQCTDYLKCYHKVQTVEQTLLERLLPSSTGFVTSNHHQAIDQLAPALKVNAYAPDGIIEGVEWAAPKGRSFLIAVQWHPERMDVSNAYSGLLLNAFKAQAHEYSTTHFNHH